MDRTHSASQVGVRVRGGDVAHGPTVVRVWRPVHVAGRDQPVHQLGRRSGGDLQLRAEITGAERTRRSLARDHEPERPKIELVDA
jgi:hypothetical protein